MYKKIRFTILNIFFLCVAFGIMFFGSVTSYADTVRETDVIISSRNGTRDSSNGYTDIVNTYTLPDNVLCCLYLDYQYEFQGTPIYHAEFYVNVSNYYNVRQSWNFYYQGVLNPNQSGTSNQSYNFDWSNVNGVYFGGPSLGTNSFSVSANSGHSCPIFYDFADVQSYLINGTMPEKEFDPDLKLDRFKVISKGDWIQEALNGFVAFNHIVVQPFWSDPFIDSVEVTVYALDPSYNYNPRNWTYSSTESGVFHDFDISGLTLHGQQFVVRATPYSGDYRGVSIQYQFTFPDTFDQPIGQLIIPSDNTYPYSTTIDISGNDVPIEWTVTQTPIYVYETNNVENYYYGDPVSYPVPEITENTENNYYETYVNNYYNTYNEVVNNYDVNFDIDISDVSGSDIQQTYDDFGNFFKGFGGFIGKLVLLFSGLFPFLSPLVATTLVTVVGIIVLGAIVILFLKVLHIL